MGDNNLTQHEGATGVTGIMKKNKHKAAVVWLTGLSGSGKSTIASNTHLALSERNCQTFVLDGDDLRRGLSNDLTFTKADRKENIRRAGEVASLFYRAGTIAICAFISPFKADRDFVKSQVPPGSFFEVYIECSIEECMRRDPKGLYKKAIDHSIPDFTGISSPYEPPLSPSLTLNTEIDSVAESTGKLLQLLEANGILSLNGLNF